MDMRACELPYRITSYKKHPHEEHCRTTFEVGNHFPLVYKMGRIPLGSLVMISTPRPPNNSLLFLPSPPQAAGGSGSWSEQNAPHHPTNASARVQATYQYERKV